MASDPPETGRLVSDTELLQHHLDGDPEAFGALIRRLGHGRLPLFGLLVHPQLGELLVEQIGDQLEVAGPVQASM